MHCILYLLLFLQLALLFAFHFLETLANPCRKLTTLGCICTIDHTALTQAQFYVEADMEAISRTKSDMKHCLTNSEHTRFHGLLKTVTMSGHCVIYQVTVPGLGYNWTTFYTLAAVTTGWGTNSAHRQLNTQVADKWLNILWFFWVLTCSTILLGGGIFQTIKSCIAPTKCDIKHCLTNSKLPYIGAK